MSQFFQIQGLGQSRSKRAFSQRAAYSTLSNKSSGTAIFRLGMLFIWVGIFIDFMSYISNSNEKSLKPQAVQFDMIHVGT